MHLASQWWMRFPRFLTIPPEGLRQVVYLKQAEQKLASKE
jgi:hypothetical protein